MQTLASRIDDLIWIISDPVILVPAGITVALLLLSVMAAYSLRRLRKERALVEPDIADVLIRLRLYSLLIREEGQSLIASRNRCFLDEAIERWTTLRFHRWNDFQLYLAFRYVRALHRSASRDERDVLLKLTAALRVALRACPGNPRMNFVLAVINNGVAEMLGMYPSTHPVRPRALDPNQRVAGAEHDETAYNLALTHIFDPYALEKTVLQQLEFRPVSYLLDLLRSVEWENIQSGFTPRNCSNPLMAEMVLWIVHEERFGTLEISAATRDLRNVVGQLIPQLPDYLRSRPIRSVEVEQDNQLRVVFEDTQRPLGQGTAQVHLGMVVRTGDKVWRAGRIEADIGAARVDMVFASATSADLRKRNRTTEQPPVEPAGITGQRLAS